jgi:glycosyltransferase involved in cell wall biosynthesis
VPRLRRSGERLGSDIDALLDDAPPQLCIVGQGWPISVALVNSWSPLMAANKDCMSEPRSTCTNPPSGKREVPLKLSVVIPVFNEAVLLPVILNRVVAAIPEVEKEIIVVDDCSTDGTAAWLRHAVGEEVKTASVGPDGRVNFGCPDPDSPTAAIRALYHPRNSGKGAALRTGFAVASGDVLVVQDADLEYDPAEWVNFWPLFTNNIADVVYGSRFHGRPHRSLYYHHYLGNRLISFLFSVFYNQILTDLEVCYKMFVRSVLPLLTLRCNDFGFEIEFSSNVARTRTLRIYEIGISYYGRTYAEGKKINWKDGIRALFYILKFRF